MSKISKFQWGILLSGIAVLMSFVVGIYMGTSEDAIREGWAAAAAPALAADPEKLAGLLDKAWTCLIRTHLHFGAIGAATLVMSYILSGVKALPNWYRQAASIFMGIGALTYPISWYKVANNLLILGPGAKATGHIYAAIGIGTLIVGTVMFLIGLIYQAVKNNEGVQDSYKAAAK